MLCAGVAWDDTGYQLAVLDPAGESPDRTMRFGPDRVDDMIAVLHQAGRELITVIDSTNGVLDGRMMAQGLGMYRADPAVLPERPLIGSVSALELARLACRDPRAITRLDPKRGTQTGREDDLEAGYTSSEAAVRQLVAQGRWLAHGDRARPECALTFDDGPLPPYTDQVMDVLARYAIPATFFCVGINARGYPEQLRRMRAEGHAIGNHTWSHPFLPELTRQQLRVQLELAGEMIATAAGGEPPTIFRPPYGSRTPDVVRWLGETMATSVVWDVYPVDWAMPGTEVIARTVLDTMQPGSIVLLHDGGGDRSQTVAALPQIIEGMLERGYRFVAVTDLLACRPSEQD